MGAKVKKVKDLKFKTQIVMINYARNGHLLYEDPVDCIPEHIKEYYVWYKSTARMKTYIEVTEDREWMEE